MTADEITERCRWATDQNEGRPSSSWSTGEQVAVALVLRDKDYLATKGYTLEQAAERVCDTAELTPFELTGWLNDIRRALETEQRGGNPTT